MSSKDEIEALRDKIQQFVWLLNEQVQEKELEEKGTTIRLYFDSWDIRAAILGFHDLYTGHKYDIEGTFETDEYLVQCLAVSGRLGEIYMLPPHQAELLPVLNPRWRTFDDEEAERFLREVAFGKTIPSLKGKSNREVYELVKKYAVYAIRAFKAFQSIGGSLWEIGGTLWQKRLAHMRKTGILNFDKPRARYAQLIQSPEFLKLKHAFDQRRPRRTINNFADAVVLNLLIESTDRFKEKPNDDHILPHFFASSRLFNDVAGDAGLGERLKYRTGGNEYSVLKPASYFVYKSIFRPPGDETSTVRFDMRQVRDEVQEILRNPNIKEDLIIQSLGVPVLAITNNMYNLSFFQNVWRMQPKEADKVLKELDWKQIGRKRFIEGVESAVRQTEDELKQNSKDHRWISSFWDNFDTQKEKLREGVNKMANFQYDFHLLRFSLPDHTPSRTWDTLNKLRQTREGDEDAFVLLIHTYLMLHEDQYDNDTEKENDLALVCAVLWLIEMYEDLIALLDHPKLTHYAFKIVFAAAIIEKERATPRDDRWHSRSIKRVERMIDCLKKDYENAQIEKTKGEIAVGLAFLFYRYWLSFGFRPAWRENSVEPLNSEKRGRELAKDAIAYAEQAYGHLREMELPQALYSMIKFFLLAI